MCISRAAGSVVANTSTAHHAASDKSKPTLLYCGSFLPWSSFCLVGDSDAGHFRETIGEWLTLAPSFQPLPAVQIKSNYFHGKFYYRSLIVPTKLKAIVHRLASSSSPVLITLRGPALRLLVPTQAPASLFPGAVMSSGWIIGKTKWDLWHFWMQLQTRQADCRITLGF